ncbi:hypothetical protein [Demequina sp. NBRC 110052]|uniref:hypothetical protein n=1 Tax=Demequina sp. NBRC 110052 TaxID=1570341 RepID=UPI000A03FF23|nr:hypothetical protein [Demequina sp. NBRC 110052]
MALFRRKKDRTPTADPAFPFLTMEEGAHLRALVTAAFRQSGVDAQVGPDAARTPDGAVHPLRNLAAVFSSAAPDERAGAVFHHVGAVLRAQQSASPLTPQTVLDSACLRLMDRAALPAGWDAELAPYSTTIGAGMRAVLAVDTPESVMTVPAGVLADTDMAAAWSAATARLRAVEVEERDVLESPGGPIHRLAGGSYFVASRLMVLEDEIERVGDARRGVLVAVPDRHRLLFHVIEDLGAVQAVSALAAVARDGYASAPGALSPEVFWWYRGAVQQVTATEADGSTKVLATGAFAEAMNGLPPHAGADEATEGDDA